MPQPKQTTEFQPQDVAIVVTHDMSPDGQHLIAVNWMHLPTNETIVKVAMIPVDAVDLAAALLKAVGFSQITLNHIERGKNRVERPN